MKKITFLMMSFMMFAFGYAQDAIITGYVDSPCPGADGRTIEIYVNGTVDFTDWNLARQSNGGGFTTNVDLTSLGSLTDEFVYVTNDEATLDVEFTINSTTHNVIENSVISSNGDDAFQITDAGDVVVDRFGEENVNGTGTAWEHVDTYYYRNDGATANAGAFDPANWTFGTQDALDGLGLCNSSTPLSDTVPFGSYMSTVSNPGESCANPIAITGLPYTTSDDTANYGNNYNNGDSPCDSYYLSGDEAIYAFTPANNMAVNISLYNVSVDYSAIHVLDACLDDSPNCVAFEGNSNSTDRNLEDVNLTGGQTYYIVVSTWASPQSVQYELSIEEITCPATADVVFNNITQTSADVSWTSFGSETEWEILYGEAGFDPLVDGTSVTDNDGTLGETLSGLTLGTTYDVYVRAMCSATDMSDWTAVTTFSTACDIINTAYTEDFESSGTTPACWSVINQGGANGWSLETNPTGGAYSGNNVMSIVYNTDAHDDYLIMPATEVISGVTERVSFWLKSSSSFSLEPFEVLLSTTGNTSDASFVEVLQAEIEAPNEWTQYEFDLSAYAGQTVHVAIRATGTDEFRLFADDFVFDALPSCIEPTDVVFSNITQDSVDVSWTSNGSETEWEILYGEAGFDPMVDGTSVMDTDGTLGEILTGLNDGTNYEIYVRADCGSGDLSSWAGPESFSTACPVFNSAYTEDFESVSSLPACWSVINQGGANEWEFDSSPDGGALSGDNVMAIVFNSSAHDDYLIMPATEVIAGTTDMVSFSLKSRSSIYLEPFEVVLSTTDNMLDTSFDEVLQAEIEAPNEWTQYEFDLSAYAGQIVYVAIRATGTDEFELYADDFAFGTNTVCAAPTDVIFTNIDDTSADVAWLENGTATEWEILYGEAGFDPLVDGTSIIDNDGTLGETLTGLTAATDYDVYVRALCGSSDESSWFGPAAFTTTTLGLESVGFDNFSYYPNPVKNELVLKAGQVIDQIDIYNLRGQVLMSENVESINAKINLQKLQSGIYLMKVKINNATKTFKLIRE